MTKLFVGNLSYDVVDADLRTTFAAHGTVSAVDIVMDRATGKSRGFAFVEMPRQAHATAAIQALDGTALKGRTINVSLARPRATGGRGDASPGWAVVGDGHHRW